MEINLLHLRVESKPSWIFQKSHLPFSAILCQPFHHPFSITNPKGFCDLFVDFPSFIEHPHYFQSSVSWDNASFLSFLQNESSSCSYFFTGGAFLFVSCFRGAVQSSVGGFFCFSSGDGLELSTSEIN